EKVSPLAASYAQAGMADLALYEGRFEDAVQILERGVTADLAAKYLDRAAAKLAMIAYIRLLQNHKPQALAAARKALEVSKIPRSKFLAGRIFAEAGDTPRAKTLAAELSMEIQSEPRAYGKLIEGEIALAGGNPAGAITAFTDANGQLDTW